MQFRLIALALALWTAVAPIEAARASQNALYSPTTGTVSGLSLTNSYNSALDSLNTFNSGASAPTNQLSGVPSLGNSWLDTASSPNPLSIYDGNSWVPRGALDATNHIWDGQVGGGTNSIASGSGSPAGTPDLCSVPQYFLTVTGTTTITGFGSSCPAGVQKLITFAAALNITYNSGSLILPGAGNITTSAGDVAIALALGGGNWQIVSYFPANGSALINPSIDVGAILYFSGGAPPSGKYLEGYGQAISRTTYSTYLGVATNTQSVTRTSGSPTLTGFTDTTRFNAGQHVEGSGIPTGATIASTTSTTVTLSANAISSGTANVTVFYYGNGDGATTFNMPNCAGQLLVGRGNMGGTANNILTSTYALGNPNAMGSVLGAQSETLTQAQLPNVSPTFTGTAGTVTVSSNGIGSNIIQVSPSGTVFGIQSSGNAGSASGSFTPAGSISPLGSGNAHSIVNPMQTVECMVRVLP